MPFSKNLSSDNKKIHVIFAVTLPLVSFFIVLLFFGIKYEVNDDAIMSNIASGAVGGHTERLIYTNIILGYILKVLYSAFTVVNWYTVIQLSAVLVCFSILCYIAIDKLSLFHGCMLGGIFLIMIGFDILMWFQYSKNAAVLAVTGIVLIRLSLEELNKRNACIGITLGVFIALLGSLIRFESFVAVGAMSIPFILMGLNRSNLLKRAVTIGILVLLTITLEAIDVMSYRTSSEWKDFYSFNAVRQEISDRRIYETNVADAQSYGLNENEYRLVLNWNFYDPEHLSTERLAQVAQLMPTRGLLDTVKDTAYVATHFVYKSPPFLFVGFLLLAFVFLSNRKKGRWFLRTFVILGVVLLYLMSGARLPHRVEIILVFSISVFGLFCFPFKKGESPSRALTAFALCAAVLVSGGYLEQQKQILSDRGSREEASIHYDTLSNDKENLYIMDTSHLDRMMGYDVFEVKPQGYFSNIVFLGSWYSRSPLSEEVLSHYGHSNPYRAILENNVYLVGEPLTKQAHLQQYYDSDAVLVEETQKSTPMYAVYKVEN